MHTFDLSQQLERGLPPSLPGKGLGLGLYFPEALLGISSSH